MLRICLLLAIVMAATAPDARAQDDSVIARARAASAAGRRGEALQLLEAHLARTPRDVDARLVYGLVLSWERRYDDARRELQQVLSEAPDYDDARVALMNVDWWTGRTREARDAAESILANQPGNPAARRVRERLDAAARPWEAAFGYTFDSFSDDRSTWHESAVTLTRHTPAGPVLGRVSRAERFDLSGSLYEAEFYPRLGPRTSAFVSAGGSGDDSFYPSFRFGADLYQNVGHGLEVAVGYRRLQFDDPTNVYLGALSQYAGTWLFSARVYHVPSELIGDATSYHGAVRKYVRGDGVSYVGGTYSHGFTRDEIRNLADLATLDSDTIRIESVQLLRQRWRLTLAAGTGRQDRTAQDALWQTTVNVALGVSF